MNVQNPVENQIIEEKDFTNNVFLLKDMNLTSETKVVTSITMAN